MDTGRVTLASDDHGSLLNKVYEMQCVREREMNQIKQMSEVEHSMQMNQSYLSSEDRLFLSTPSLRPGHGHKLEQDLVCLSSAMTGMSVGMQEPSPPLTDPSLQTEQQQ